jgi:hypothetical protein
MAARRRPLVPHACREPAREGRHRHEVTRACLIALGFAAPAAKSLEDADGSMREMQVSDVCYEIYGKNGAARLEIYYDPMPGAELQPESD